MIFLGFFISIEIFSLSEVSTMVQIMESNIVVGYTSMQDLPGVVRVHVDLEDANPEDVSLDVHDDYIDVFASMEEDVELLEGVMHKQGEIYRHIDLPANLDVDNLQCSME